MLNWSQCNAVERLPGRVSGTWLFRGTRVPVDALFANFEDGVTCEELIQLFRGVTMQHVRTVLDHARHSLSDQQAA